MSSILETFFFMFEADASKVRKGVDEAEKKTGELEKGLNNADDAATRVGGSLLKVATSVGAAIGGFVAFASIKATIHETAMAIDDLADSADALGLPVDQLSAWSMAATMADGSQQGFISSLDTINKGFNAIATKGTGLMLPFLKELGISLTDTKRYAKDPLAGLLAMSDAFSKLSRAEAAGLGAKIGLDQGTINLLSKGRAGIDELLAAQRELGVVTKEQAEEAGKYDEQLKKNSATYETLKRELVMGALPAVTWFLETVRRGVEWMKENKNVVGIFFGAAAAVLTTVYLPAAIASASATWALIAPILAVVLPLAAFAAALALVVDDLWNFLQGNDSVLGELCKRWPLFGTIVNGVIDSIGTTLVSLIEILRSVCAFFVDLFTQGPQVAVQNLVKSLGALGDYIVEKFPVIGDVMQVVFDAIGASINWIVGLWDWLIGKIQSGIALFQGAANFIGGGIGAIGDALGFGGDDKTRAAVAAGQAQIAVASSTPLASQTSNAIANHRNVSKQTTVHAPVNVHTQATDAEGTARAVSDSLGSQLKYAVDQNDDGVAA